MAEEKFLAKALSIEHIKVSKLAEKRSRVSQSNEVELWMDAGVATAGAGYSDKTGENEMEIGRAAT